MFYLSRPVIMGAAATVLSAGPVWASPKADTNGDGEISKYEFTMAASNRFIDTDINNDGRLTMDEMKAYREKRKQARAEERFSQSDLNGDGFISKSEFDTIQEQRAAKMQERRQTRRGLNKGGADDAADQALREERRAAWKQRRAERRQGDAVTRKNFRHHIKRDADGDGIITRAEYDAATDAMFLRLDVNADGVLTKGEGRKKRRGKRGIKNQH